MNFVELSVGDIFKSTINDDNDVYMKVIQPFCKVDLEDEEPNTVTLFGDYRGELTTFADYTPIIRLDKKIKENLK